MKNKRISYFTPIVCVTVVLLFLTAVLDRPRQLTAQEMTREALEEEFFELMEAFNSPKLEERETVEETLFRRFVEFEPVWKDRRFLTSGEVSAEACERFLSVESRWRYSVFEETKNSFSCEWRLEDDNKRGIAQISWDAPCRAVYLIPALDLFFWSGCDGVWRSVVGNSLPEITPAFEERKIEVESAVERQDEDKQGNSFYLDALLGLDLREIELPVFMEEEEMTPLRSGELTLEGALATKLEQGGWKIAVRFEYDQAFDAFDSHRVWFDINDFALKTAENEATIAPKKMRSRFRNARGTVVELEFEDDVELDVAIVAGIARASCRLPRFFARMAISQQGSNTDK